MGTRIYRTKPRGWFLWDATPSKAQALRIARNAKREYKQVRIVRPKATIIDNYWIYAKDRKDKRRKK